MLLVGDISDIYISNFRSMLDDLPGGIHDTLRQIRGVAHHPLRPKRMTCQQHRCQQAEAYSPSHRTGA